MKTLLMVVISSFTLQACAESSGANSNGRWVEEVKHCAFSATARRTLERLGFFSVGDSSELFRDSALPSGTFSGVNTDGAHWFFAYPVCRNHRISYESLPDLLKSGLNAGQVPKKDGELYVFTRPEYLTDLFIVSFGEYVVAFYKGRP